MLYGKLDGDNGYLLVWLKGGGSGGTAIRWSGGYIEEFYLMEKMNLRNRADATALLKFLGEHGHDVDDDFVQQSLDKQVRLYGQVGG